MHQKLTAENSEEVDAPRAGAANAAYYASTDLVGRYATKRLRAVEVVMFDRYGDELRGTVLDVGCGAGRLSGHLAAAGGEVHGIDVSPTMVDYCRRTYTGSSFSEADMRDLSRFEPGTFDVVLASFNVIDAVDHADRRRTLGEFRRVLKPGGLLIMSSHNLSAAGAVVGPAAEIVAQMRARRLRGTLGGVAHLGRRIRNRRRLRNQERSGPGYQIVNDAAHDYSLLHYYVSPPCQVRQLAAHGFELIECLDLSGQELEPVEDASSCSELHYVARLGSKA
jgi:2-polyprenyl-3-methyl-5-hydroxy-6-metoxy-1,4-benzoquinol methylase